MVRSGPADLPEAQGPPGRDVHPSQQGLHPAREGPARGSAPLPGRVLGHLHADGRPGRRSVDRLNRGMVYQAQGEFQKAFNEFDRCRELFEGKVADRLGLAKALSGCGLALGSPRRPDHRRGDVAFRPDALQRARRIRVVGDRTACSQVRRTLHARSIIVIWTRRYGMRKSSQSSYWRSARCCSCKYLRGRTIST